MVDEHALGRDPEEPGDLALHPDRDVAEPDRAVPLVEQRARHDPDGVREVDDPGVRRGEGANALGDLQHDRHGAHCLREPARAGRLLADAPARERDRLVAQPGRLAADAELEEDERGVRDGCVEVVGDGQRPAEALPLEHASRHLPDDRASLGVDVVEDELVDGNAVALPREPGHELRRVRRAAADHRQLHPFTPVSVTPSTNAFWARKNTTTTGSITSTVAAIVRFHCTWWSERNCERPIEVTQLAGFSLR